MSKVLLTPRPGKLVRAQHDLRMFELVNSTTAGNLPDAGFSLAYLMLEPDELSDATAAGGLSSPMRYVQHPGQALVIPPRQPHRAANLSSTTMLTGFEVRVRSESVFADNNLLPFSNGLGFELVGDSATPQVALAE